MEKVINVIGNGAAINKEEFQKLLGERFNIDSFRFDFKRCEENEPVVWIVDAVRFLDTLQDILANPRPYKIALGVVGICGGTVYVDNQSYYDCNVYVVGGDSVEKVLAIMASKSWFHANFLVEPKEEVLISPMTKEEAKEKLMVIANGLFVSMSCTCLLGEKGKNHLVGNLNSVINAYIGLEGFIKLHDLKGCVDSIGQWERKIDKWLNEIEEIHLQDKV